MMTAHSRSTPCTARPGTPAQLLARLLGMLELARQRRHLATLSDWELKDIGLSRADVEAETEKPFWRF